MYESTIHYSGKSEIGYPQKRGRRGRKRQTGGENGSLRRFCRIFAGASRLAAFFPKGSLRDAQTRRGDHRSPASVRNLHAPPLCKGRCRRQPTEGLLQSKETTPQSTSSGCFSVSLAKSSVFSRRRKTPRDALRLVQLTPCTGEPKERTKRHAPSLSRRIKDFPCVKTPPRWGGVFCAFVYLPSSSPGSFAMSPAPIVRMRSPARAFARR